MRRVCAVFAMLWAAFAMPWAMAEEGILTPQVAGQFYPADSEELGLMVDGYLAAAPASAVNGHVCAVIAAHAGYGYSGATAARAYKLIQGRPYTMVVVLGTAHRFPFAGVSVNAKGAVRTPLGVINIDEEFASKLLDPKQGINVEPRAFVDEHSMEVQLPFLQRALKDFRVVPVVVGDCTLETARRFAALLEQAVGERGDVLIVASSDLYHGYDYKEADVFDKRTLDALKADDAERLYSGLRDGSMQACGGFGMVIALLVGRELGCTSVEVLGHTTSAAVTGRMQNGTWTVGYPAAAVYRPGAGGNESKSGGAMLNTEQRKKLLALARSSIETWLKTGAKLQVSESDPVLTAPAGAFVTLQENGQLRGCIGSLEARTPLYLTVRDMAVQAATQDPRFEPVTAAELKKLELEISVLTPFTRVASAQEIELGRHGVMVKRGFRSGVFLPQVATETGWTKERFLSELCAQKAGIAPDAWKDPATELYTFTAEVFSEQGY